MVNDTIIFFSLPEEVVDKGDVAEEIVPSNDSMGDLLPSSPRDMSLFDPGGQC